MKLNRKLAHRMIEGKVFVMDPGKNTLHSFNGTASLIWKGICGGEDDKTIAKSITETYDVSMRTGLQDVREFISMLRSKGLFTESG